MIHITPVNKCRHYGCEYVTAIAIKAKCNAHSLLMPDVHSKKNATRASAMMANTAQVHFDIVQCLLITSKMLDLCTVGLLYPIVLPSSDREQTDLLVS